jgi:hypothetical protein
VNVQEVRVKGRPLWAYTLSLGEAIVASEGELLHLVFLFEPWQVDEEEREVLDEGDDGDGEATPYALASPSIGVTVQETRERIAEFDDIEWTV